jgi:hypothetical protein
MLVRSASTLSGSVKTLSGSADTLKTEADGGVGRGPGDRPTR